jgi:hypothetical protein
MNNQHPSPQTAGRINDMDIHLNILGQLTKIIPSASRSESVKNFYILINQHYFISLNNNQQQVHEKVGII